MGRRDVSPEADGRWVFNRLAADYRARPGYPPALVERLAALAGGPGAAVADLGAGTGLLALPLARAGLRVAAVEPAREMLAVVAGQGAPPELQLVHAAAESTGLTGATFALVVLADALQWVEPERAGREAGRLLAPGGALAVVEARWADAPFARGLEALLARANPKARPRSPERLAQLFAAAGVREPRAERFAQSDPLAPDALAAILRSLSYAGPALGPAALGTLLDDASALAAACGGAVWARELTLTWGRAAP